MSVHYDSQYTSDFTPEPEERETEPIWSQTIAAVLVAAVALLFVSFLVVAMGLA